MKAAQHVLVVDELTETEEVLQTVLAPRGLVVERLGGWATAVNSSPALRPDVVVIDADSLPQQFPTCPDWQDVPQVIIGHARNVAGDTPAATSRQRHLAKPFQFPELIQAVEQLLADASR